MRGQKVTGNIIVDFLFFFLFISVSVNEFTINMTSDGVKIAGV